MTSPPSGAAERLAVAVASPAHDYASVWTDLRVDRWDEDQTSWVLEKITAPPGFQPEKRHFERLRVKPYLTTIDENCNLITTSGWAALLGSIGGTSIGTKFSNTAGRIGAGTSSTAATGAQTFLVGDTGAASTTSYYALCGVAPTINTTGTGANLDVCTMVFTATFGSAVGNFAWNEFGTDNAAASGVNLNGLAGGPYVFLNRGVSAQGTKTAGQTWTATETITFGFPSGAGTVN